MSKFKSEILTTNNTIDSGNSTYTHNPNVRIYILCHTDKRLATAKTIYSQYYWAKPIRMKYQDFTFENAFWKQLLEIKEEWLYCDMVGTMSFTANTKIQLYTVDRIIRDRSQWGNGYYNFMSTGKPNHITEHPHLIPILKDVCRVLRVPIPSGNFNNYWMCKPDLMVQFISWFQSKAKNIVIQHPLAMSGTRYDSGALKAHELKALCGVPFYPHAPFVFEQLNKVFFDKLLLQTSPPPVRQNNESYQLASTLDNTYADSSEVVVSAPVRPFVNKLLSRRLVTNISAETPVQTVPSVVPAPSEIPNQAKVSVPTRPFVNNLLNRRLVPNTPAEESSQHIPTKMHIRSKTPAPSESSIPTRTDMNNLLNISLVSKPASIATGKSSHHESSNISLPTRIHMNNLLNRSLVSKPASIAIEEPTHSIPIEVPVPVLLNKISVHLNFNRDNKLNRNNNTSISTNNNNNISLHTNSHVLGSNNLYNINNRYSKLSNSAHSQIQTDSYRNIDIKYEYVTNNFNLPTPFLSEDIPRVIYQTWSTKFLPFHMAETVKTIININPTYNYELYDDVDCRNFIKQYFPPQILYAYDTLIPGAYKADLWRYCILYLKGGIYLDIKFIPVNGFTFDSVISEELFCYDYKDSQPPGGYSIYNAFMICRAGNKQLEMCIYDIFNHCINKYYGNSTLAPTGPWLLGKYINENMCKLRNTNHSISNDYNMVLNSYPAYREEQNARYIVLRTTHYSALWANRAIYDTSILLETYIMYIEEYINNDNIIIDTVPKFMLSEEMPSFDTDLQSLTTDIILKKTPISTTIHVGEPLVSMIMKETTEEPLVSMTMKEMVKEPLVSMTMKETTEEPLVSMTMKEMVKEPLVSMTMKETIVEPLVSMTMKEMVKEPLISMIMKETTEEPLVSMTMKEMVKEPLILMIMKANATLG
jgi:hypothetical protein